jgi:DNA-binding MarR family transcriptional regulator
MLNDFTFKEIIARLTQYFAQLGKPTFSELTKALRLSKPSITAIIGKLAMAGYVKKEKSLEDKRSFFINLTDKGRKVCMMHDDMHERIINGFRRYISETEIDRLMTILNKISNGIINEKNYISEGDDF